MVSQEFLTCLMCLFSFGFKRTVFSCLPIFKLVEEMGCVCVYECVYVHERGKETERGGGTENKQTVFSNGNKLGTQSLPITHLFSQQ